MTVELKDFAVCSHFLFVPSLAVECILGTQYTSRYVDSIRCIRRGVELLDGSVVPIMLFMFVCKKFCLFVFPFFSIA